MRATSKLFGYEYMYEVNDRANVVLFWVKGSRKIWLGIADFFDHFTTMP